jgi:hypothetical protein
MEKFYSCKKNYLNQNMMKKTNFLMLFALMLLMFNCRQESMYVEQDSQNNFSSKNYVINSGEIKKDPKLWSAISGIQTNLFEADPSKKNIDPLLNGAVIMTDYAGVMEKNGNTTYTFEIKRMTPVQDLENLVLRRNSNGSYSGILIQYHLSKEEIQAFQNATKPEDIKNKISVYRINNININSKDSGYTYSEQIGCLVVNYEVIPCASSDQHTNPSQCSLTGASAPQIILLSVDDTHCVPSGEGQGNPGSGTIPGGSQGGGSGQGSNTPPENLYNTFLFSNFGDDANICTAGDTECEENRQLNLQLQAYLLTLSPKTSILSAYLYTFLTIKGYFKINGSNTFLTDRLNMLAGWYNNPANANIPELEKHKFINWGLNFLIQNPDTTWEQFENWFITKSEGNDGEPIDNLDDILNTMQYQTRAMPTYNQFVAAFPKLDYPGYPGYYKQIPASQVYPMVGGNLENLYNTTGKDTGPYRNACTVRWSMGMNGSGILIPNNSLSRRGADKNGQARYYYLQAKTAGDFMQKTFGNPNYKLEGTDVNNPNKVAVFLKGKTGIYVIVNNDPTTAGYTGHVDLIQNGHIPGGANAYNVPGGIKSIRIWEFKP